MKNYEILGGNLPVVVCELSAGESMITESGSMSWMSSNMKMETVSGGGMKKMLGRFVSGDSVFQNRFTASLASSDGFIDMTPAPKGAGVMCLRSVMRALLESWSMSAVVLAVRCPSLTISN